MDRFQVGYQAITWALGPLGLEQGIKDIAALGFKYFETLNLSTLADDWARRTLRVGDIGLPHFVGDIEYFTWLNLLIDAKMRYGLQPASIFCNAEFINPIYKQREIEQFRGTAAILHGLGARHLVCGGGPPTTGEHSSAEYAAMASTLEEMGRHCKEFDVQLCFHPHVDTFVQDARELRQFVDSTDGDLVALCIDPGHLALKGVDSIAVFETYMDRIRYCHFKDVRGENVTELQGGARWGAFHRDRAGLHRLQKDCRNPAPA